MFDPDGYFLVKKLFPAKSFHPALKDVADDPDIVVWKHPGDLWCMAARMPGFEGGGGVHYCGYVGVPFDHDFHGMNYNMMYGVLDVHGGPTYAGTMYKDYDIPEFGTHWFIGFDCAHSSDFSGCDFYTYKNVHSPIQLMDKASARYKNIDFVIRETNSLADQLNKIDISKLVKDDIYGYVYPDDDDN